jgi:hypothetical protein
MIKKPWLVHLSRWRLVYFVGASVTAFAVGEAIARFGFGLGEPPLVIRDDDCGYRFAPNQSVKRFGNRISYDANSVRISINSIDGEDKNVMRVLVVGDSVLNGGALTDDAETATSTLNQMFLSRGGKTLSFINLSAGSWAPPQQYGYLRAHGTLDADAVVFVFNSSDALGNVRANTPPFPTLKPWCALEELVLRYGAGINRHFMADEGGWAITAFVPPDGVAKSSEPTAVSCWCLDQMLGLCEARGIPVAVVFWPKRPECESNLWESQMEQIRDACRSRSVQVIDCLGRIAAMPSLDAIYIDTIHPTTQGQLVLAGALLEAVDTAFDGHLLEGH